MPLSFFSRLYVNIILTVVFSVFLSYILVEHMSRQDELKQFSRDAWLVSSYVEQDFEHLVFKDEVQMSIDLPYPFNHEFSAKLVKKSSSLTSCKNCDLTRNINGYNFYELEEGEWFVSLPLKNRDYNFVFYEKIDDERTPEELEEIENDPEDGPYIIISLISTLVIFLGITVYWPVKQLQREVKNLIRSHLTFGKGNLHARADENIQRPMNELALSFNEMAEAISNNVKEREIFAQAIPHEVRTPLSRIQLASGLIRKKNNDLDTLTLLDDVDNYVTDINHLISQIVEFTRLNEHKRVEQDTNQAINVGEFIQSRIKLLSRLADKKIECSLPSKIRLTTNSIYLRLLVDNLIKNAINHANSKINISASEASGQLHIVVEDDGAGVPEDQVETIFFPFARLDQSRNRATGGLGLGLSIAKAAAEKMNGRIHVSRSSQGGASFEFKTLD